jgi:hypothetical protein
MKEFQIRKWQKEKMTCQVWLLLVSLAATPGRSSHPKTGSQPDQIPQTNRSFCHKHLHVKALSKIQVTKYSSGSHGHVEALLCGLTYVIKLLCTRCERPWDLSKIALLSLEKTAHILHMAFKTWQAIQLQTCWNYGEGKKNCDQWW